MTITIAATGNANTPQFQIYPASNPRPALMLLILAIAILIFLIYIVLNCNVQSTLQPWPSDGTSYTALLLLHCTKLATISFRLLISLCSYLYCLSTKKKKISLQLRDILNFSSSPTYPM